MEANEIRGEQLYHALMKMVENRSGYMYSDSKMKVAEIILDNGDKAKVFVSIEIQES